MSRVQTFVNTCFHCYIGALWFDTILNEELQVEVEVLIRRRKGRWIGHTLRKARVCHTIESIIIEWTTQGLISNLHCLVLPNVLCVCRRVLIAAWFSICYEGFHFAF